MRMICLLLINLVNFNNMIANTQNHLVLIVPSYNNAKYVEKNLASLINQTYQNYQIIYINDCSTDQTGALALNYLKQFAPPSLKFTYIENQQNMGAGYNRYIGAHLTQATDILLFVDGDDFLADENVLNDVNRMYQDPNIWLTYGQFLTTIGQKSLILPINYHTDFRKAVWCFTHLRTFRSALFKKIKLKDFLYEGQFFSSASDLAESLPALEMARGHTQLANRVLYHYNLHQQNDHQINHQKQLFFDRYCRAQKPYRPLKSLDSNKTSHIIDLADNTDLTKINQNDFIYFKSNHNITHTNLDQLLDILKNTHLKVLIFDNPPTGANLVDLSIICPHFKIQALDLRAKNQPCFKYKNQPCLIKASLQATAENDLTQIISKQEILLFAQAKI